MTAPPMTMTRRKEDVSVLVKDIAPGDVKKSVEQFSEATVRALSAARNEPEWMLEKRLAAWAQRSRRAKARPQIVLKSDDIRISRLPWETPVYKITADDSINIGLVGNDMAGTWRLLGGSATIP